MYLYSEVYGCTLNQGEARILTELALKEGFTPTEKIDCADLILLSTCTVIESTERRMLKRIASLSKYKKPLVVSGCMAAVQRGKISLVAPEAIILPPAQTAAFQSFLRKLSPKSSQEMLEKTVKKYVDAIIPISQGCLGKCTYCITQLARGVLRSYPKDDIVAEARRQIAMGAKEIKLTAQDTASYGMDNGTSLFELVSEIANLEGDFRIRIGMMNPSSALKILTELIKLYKYEKVYKFLHLPLQSGSNKLLAQMARGYSVEEFEYIVRKVRECIEDIMLSTDIIVGFPGEGEVDFEESVKVVKAVKPDILNVTRFSAREGTLAARLPNQIVSRIVKERSRRLSAIRFEISEALNTKFVGKIEKILIVEAGKNNTLVGRTSTYRPVVIKKNGFKIGDFALVKITSAKPTYLVGELVG